MTIPSFCFQIEENIMKRILLFAASLVAAAHPALPQDPVKLSPQMYTVLLENEHVRVLEFRAKSGEKEPVHSHPAAVVYFLSGSKARFTTPDGKSEERESKTGTAIWSEPVTHSYEHLGPADGHILMVEMKDPAKAKR
jgi:quercetin dioxygenase-like cupin family protein